MSLIQARVAVQKQRYPGKFCPHPRCLWRTGDGRWCPRHRPRYELNSADPRQDRLEVTG